MKNHIRHLILLVAALGAFSLTARADDSVSLVNDAPAANAIVTTPAGFNEGVFSALLQASSLLITPDAALFRQMASINQGQAVLCHFAGFPFTAAYFTGRAAVFSALAEIYGEP